MSTRFEYIRALTKAAFLLLSAVCAILARGGEPYLARVGPVPLRFFEKQPSLDVSAIPHVPISTETAETNVVAEAVSLPVTNNAATNVVVASQSVMDEQKLSLGPLPQQATPAAQQTSFFPAESTPLTRAVLTELFQPMAGRTNRTAVMVTLPMDAGFAPPQPKRSESSSAVYKSE